MEITEHERVLLVNSLIQTISELYEHDGDNDRAALGALLTRMTAGHGPRHPQSPLQDRDPCDTRSQRQSGVAAGQAPASVGNTDAKC